MYLHGNMHLFAAGGDLGKWGVGVAAKAGREIGARATWALPSIGFPT